MPILHTTQAGTGPILVLIHGFLSSSRYFKYLAPKLAADFHVITIDLLGSGKSPRPETMVGYDEQVAALHETLQSLNIAEPFTLLGHSMGGLIAARYARVHKDSISSLLLFNTPIFLSRAQAEQNLRDTGPHYRAALTHPGRRNVWRTLKLLPRITSSGRGPLNYHDGLSTHHLAREGGFRHIITTAALLDDLSHIRCKTLLVIARQDRQVYLDNVASIRLNSNVNVTVVDGGHHTIARQAEMSVNLIMSHLLQ